MKQLPSQNNVGSALDRCTSTNELAILSVTAYYMDQNWAGHGGQRSFDGVDRRCFSRFES